MIRYIILPLITICVTQLAAAQQTVSLSLERCISMAMENNYNIKSSSERLAIAEDIFAAYRTARLPKISASGNYLYSTNSLTASIAGGYLPVVTNGVVSSDTFAYMPSQDMKIEIASVYNLSAILTQPIYMGGKVTSSIKLASLGIDISRQEQRRTEVEIVELTTNAFFKALETEEMLHSAEMYEQTLKEFYRQMQNATKQGMKTKSDLLRVKVELNDATLLTLKAKNGVRLAQMNLCYVVGLPLSTQDIRVVPTESQTAIIDDKELDISSRPEYVMLQQQLAARGLERDITRAEQLPSISAVASYGYTYGGQLNDAPILNGMAFSGGVMLSVPILHWGENRRKTSAKGREVQIAQNQMEDATRQMTLELLRAINNYNESVVELRLREEALEQAKENMRSSHNQYSVGMETLADYLSAQSIWQKAMSELTVAKTAKGLFYTQYLRCSGKLL